MEIRLPVVLEHKKMTVQSLLLLLLLLLMMMMKRHTRIHCHKFVQCQYLSLTRIKQSRLLCTMPIPFIFTYLTGA
jgi:hypothetical protein